MELQLGSDAVRDACLVCATPYDCSCEFGRSAVRRVRKIGTASKTQRTGRLRFSREWLDCYGRGKECVSDRHSCAFSPDT